MAFFTSLFCYRPTAPPLVTGLDLAAFVRAFHDLHLTKAPYSPLTCQLKFGRSIDQDENASSWLKWLLPPVISTTEEIAWDVSDPALSLPQLAERLTNHTQPIYRCYLDLGPAAGEIIGNLARVHSPENEIDLCLDEWSLEFGPIDTCQLGGDVAFRVGWIKVGIAGNGYLYPWSFRDLVERAERVAGMCELLNLCKRLWPVESKPPTRKQVKGRKRMGELWPYPRLDLPLDWYWGLQET